MDLGSLSEGGPADLTIIDPDHEWIIDVDAFQSSEETVPSTGGMSAEEPLKPSLLASSCTIEPRQRSPDPPNQLLWKALDPTTISLFPGVHSG